MNGSGDTDRPRAIPGDGPAADRRRSSALIVAAIASIIVGAAIVMGLDVVSARSDAGHLHRTISEYGLGAQRWVFAAGVMLVAAGSALAALVMVRRGILSVSSTTARASALWVLGLVVVAVVPQQNWEDSATIGLGGAAHRLGTVVAFVSAPVAVLSAARPWLCDVRWRRWARVAFGCGVVSVLTFVPVVYAFTVGLLTATPWWEAVTLGYVERSIVVVEIVAVLALVLWARAVAADTTGPEFDRGNRTSVQR